MKPDLVGGRQKLPAMGQEHGRLRIWWQGTHPPARPPELLSSLPPRLPPRLSSSQPSSQALIHTRVRVCVR